MNGETMSDISGILKSMGKIILVMYGITAVLLFLLAFLYRSFNGEMKSLQQESVWYMAYPVLQAVLLPEKYKEAENFCGEF